MIRGVFPKTCVGLLLAGVAAMPLATAQAGTFRVIHVFQDAIDGASPDANLISDKVGNIYGTALNGGANGDGVVYKIAPDGSETTLYSFKGGNDGWKPEAGVTRDGAGNLFGTTNQGGPNEQGTVFKLAPDGTETVLHAFTGGSDGSGPQAELVQDQPGNLYGTTASGGGQSGDGVVFEITAGGTFSVLHTFTGGIDGGFPDAGLLPDGKGNFYGDAVVGGAHGLGVVFKITSHGKFKTLYSFAGGADGANPEGTLVADSAGNLYGGTVQGGGNACNGSGCGTLFRVALDGSETVLHSFNGHRGGAEPYWGVVIDGAGNLYGTTTAGGNKNGFGTAFKLSPDGAFSILHTFTKRTGEWPNHGLFVGSNGKLYGTAYAGGKNNWGGTFFKLSK